MIVTNRILLNAENRILAFCGGKSRGLLIRRVADELAKNGKKILISVTNSRQLPVSGEMVVGKDIPILLEQVSKQFSERSIVYIGRELQEKSIVGFDFIKLNQVKSQLPADYFLIELGNGFETAIYDPKTVGKWTKFPLWDQLIYCLEISLLDRPLDERIVENLPQFQAKFPEKTLLSQNLLMEYLTDKEKGIGKIFEQEWPALLFFGDIDTTVRENRAITLARELKSNGIEHIALGDLKTNTIKKLDFS